ncbi:site-specific DNA-methyltransferase [Nostoc edaphicum CCNP1411]|uniref:Methyltransferase n=1 Tax=Nostoc edaphicum CCNP1411 TaxID=1472755 RepID=A0A7D7QL70_9NOSO|nr:site-specific DNA-methyltransferase [Nostoc edaphicum]QMS87705.1 site-specific DNA-methyltransferase [Nostoc edaphicum CCNP1411]
MVSIVSGTPLYTTDYGYAYLGDSLELLDKVESDSINLVITSPPFALQREKIYGNVDQEAYVDWLFAFCKKVYRVLKPDGSFVIDLGGAYQTKRPVRSLHNYRILIRLCDELNFRLAEEFFWYNPSKLPSPIEWVNKRKIRAKDSVNTIWWLSKTDNPKADVSKVLVPYSERMKKLQANPEKYYKPKTRPSGHDIGSAFANDNGGAIPSNLLQIANTESNSRYMQLCKAAEISPHPARFPQKLPTFFINFLTEPADIVLDIFAGSNTTGAAAEVSQRHWISFEQNKSYLAASAFRFMDVNLSLHQSLEIFKNLINMEENIKIATYGQLKLEI